MGRADSWARVVGSFQKRGGGGGGGGGGRMPHLAEESGKSTPTTVHCLRTTRRLQPTLLELCAIDLQPSPAPFTFPALSPAPILTPTSILAPHVIATLAPILTATVVVAMAAMGICDSGDFHLTFWITLQSI